MQGLIGQTRKTHPLYTLSHASSGMAIASTRKAAAGAGPSPNVAQVKMILPLLYAHSGVQDMQVTYTLEVCMCVDACGYVIHLSNQHSPAVCVRKTPGDSPLPRVLCLQM